MTTDKLNMVVRICGTCDKPLKFHEDGTQEGVYCCGEYFHEGECLDASFKDNSMNWGQHYEDVGGDNGDCYWTEWEPEYTEEAE